MRKIQPELVSYIDKRISWEGLAQYHLQTKNARGLMVEAAKACVGIKELTGRNDGRLVELIQKTVDGKAKGEAWCMAQVQSMIAYAEFKTGVRSPLMATEHCLTLWNGTPIEQKVRISPLAGAIAIWRHGTTTNGHTEIVLDCDESVFNAVGANTSGVVDPSKPINREGNGVFYTKRSRFGEGDMKLLGFIKPF